MLVYSNSLLFLRPNRLPKMDDKFSSAKRKYSLNCLLVMKDSSIALNTKGKVEQLGIKVKQIVSSLNELGEALNKNKVDIILSDVKLNSANTTLDLYKNQDNLPPLVLFSDRDTIQSTNSISEPHVFLTNAFGEEELKGAIADALKERVNGLKENGDIGRVQDTLYVRSSGKLISLSLGDINYIKAEGNYCTIHVEAKRIVIRSSISNVLKRIDKPSFVQIHRGYIANINAVKELKIKDGNLLVGNDNLPVGRKYKKELMSRKYNLL